MIPTTRAEKSVNYIQVVSAFVVGNTHSEKKIGAFEVSYILSILFNIRKEVALSDYLFAVKIHKLRAEKAVQEAH